jgi:2-polyprenyl-3-methyl-5-hydroxy-6-metoxy-1,4-benzoquinol methylase
MTIQKILSKAKMVVLEKMDYLNPYRIIAKSYINGVNKREFLHPPFNAFNERPVEYRFVFEQISELYPKKVLDVGTGVTALPHLMANCGIKVSAIDNIKDYWARGMFNRHYFVINDDIISPKIKDSFDMITCISTLEHIEKFDQAVRSMFGLLNKGGYLVLTFPYTENKFIDNVYALPGSSARQTSFKTHSYSREKVENWAKENNAEMVKQEYWQFFTGDFWTIGEKLPIPKKVSKNDKHQISCILMRKN